MIFYIMFQWLICIQAADKKTNKRNVYIFIL